MVQEVLERDPKLNEQRWKKKRHLSYMSSQTLKKVHPIQRIAIESECSMGNGYEAAIGKMNITEEHSRQEEN